MGRLDVEGGGATTACITDSTDTFVPHGSGPPLHPVCVCLSLTLSHRCVPPTLPPSLCASPLPRVRAGAEHIDVSHVNQVWLAQTDQHPYSERPDMNHIVAGTLFKQHAHW